MRKKAKRWLVAAAAALFLILGVVGLALPFLQGFLFLAVGLILLSLVWPPARHFLDRHTTRYPHLHTVVLKAEGWVTRVIGEL